MNKLEVTVKLLELLEMNNIEAYLVGGAVRDYLLGLDFKDLDIAYSDKEDKILKVLSEYKPNCYALEYGGIKLKYEGYDFELTHLRVDLEYLDNRHPSIIKKVYDVREDAKRRDFTINAMYLNSKLEVIDPLNGRADLKKKLIRTCKEADLSFKEDSLRMLRAIKFSKRLGYSLDESIVEGIKKNSSLLINSINSLKSDLDEVLSYDNRSCLLVFEMFKEKKEELAYIDQHNLSVEDCYILLNLRESLGLNMPKSFNKLIKSLKDLISNYNIMNIYQNYGIIDKVYLVSDFLNLEKLEPIIRNRSEIMISKEEILGYTKRVNDCYKDLEEQILNLKLKNSSLEIRKYMEIKYGN